MEEATIRIDYERLAKAIAVALNTFREDPQKDDPKCTENKGTVKLQAKKLRSLDPEEVERAMHSWVIGEIQAEMAAKQISSGGKCPNKEEECGLEIETDVNPLIVTRIGRDSKGNACFVCTFAGGAITYKCSCAQNV